MAKTIKIIDLLTLISKGKEVPQKVKYDENIWSWNNKLQDYENNETDYLFDLIKYNTTQEFMNTELEIIEENIKYDRPFYEIVCGLNNYALGTIIESESGQKYKLTKANNDCRKFSRIDRGLRFMTYENSKKKFRIVEDEKEQEIDIQNIVMLDLEKYGFVNTDEFAIDLVFKINELIHAFNHLDNKLMKK